MWEEEAPEGYSTGFPSVLHMYATCLLSLSGPRAGQANTQAETHIQHQKVND